MFVHLARQRQRGSVTGCASSVPFFLNTSTLFNMFLNEEL